MDTTTTRAFGLGALRAVGEPLESLDASALSEVARSVTLAQNLAGATRLHAAHLLVESFTALDEATHGGPGADTRPAHARLDPADRARHHLTAAMALTGWHARHLVTAGVQIHTRLPRLREAVERGLLPEQLAIDAACRLAGIPDDIIGGVESDVVARLTRDLAGGHRPSRTALDTTVDASRERHDPQGAGDAVDAAADKRTVRFRPERDGMTSMWAHLPSGDAEKLRRRIDAVARAAAESGHPRTRNQLRADALVALGDPNTTDIADPLPDHPADAGTAAAGSAATGTAATGTDAGAGAGRARPGASWGTDQPIRISVINSIAQGLPNRVEFVTGAYASFDWLCEELLSGGDATIRFELLDPQPGTEDTPEAALKYRISPALAERIRLRDGTCRHPGCTVDAHDCEIDHVIAFDHQRPELGGPTAEWNLVCLCRKHHREKTFGHCAYRPGPLGELTIITETGHEHHTRPHGPLAQARDRILDHHWHHHLDRLIADDGHLTNPPGVERALRATSRGDRPEQPTSPERPERPGRPA
ncbi:HNH endonuclease signature motif containing protein [Dietzia cinnamea]|uniref:HNH endonuclease signature motif containing protein n=1 Tax=Dietzia cinnamea TaxID=321318 RepID=UPI0009FFCA79|nr:HNH endonuclease signature motif containing protein [Dietzia cinnamea]MCT2121361.1 HNH endonuclease [Dietzia cinnamea]MCT2145528.1 HNH endonuclease [Dietzia cinnamea]MCT2305114.1 HNH endonuclease [Dietzia cinnamea]